MAAVLAGLILSCAGAPPDASAAQRPDDWSSGLHAETDASVYYADELRQDGALGQATLRNTLSEPVYLPGCAPYALEKEVAVGQWEVAGPQIQCVWEGLASRLDAGESATFVFWPPDGTGSWRVGFGVGIGCQDAKPLSEANCEATADGIATPPFIVHASRAAEKAGETAKPPLSRKVAEAEPAMEYDTDRPGSDFLNFDLPLAEPVLCQAACSRTAGCQAWTYVKPGVQGTNARCWLKSQVPPAVARDCCVSGVQAAPLDEATAKAKANAEAEAACKAAGGTWGPGGLLPDPLCFYPQMDADKPCRNGGDCNGHCLVGPNHVAGTAGMCSRVEPMFGCFEYLDDQGRPQGICID